MHLSFTPIPPFNNRDPDHIRTLCFGYISIFLVKTLLFL